MTVDLIDVCGTNITAHSRSPVFAVVYSSGSVVLVENLLFHDDPVVQRHLASSRDSAGPSDQATLDQGGPCRTSLFGARPPAGHPGPIADDFPYLIRRRRDFRGFMQLHSRKLQHATASP